MPNNSETLASLPTLTRDSTPAEFERARQAVGGEWRARWKPVWVQYERAFQSICERHLYDELQNARSGNDAIRAALALLDAAAYGACLADLWRHDREMCLDQMDQLGDNVSVGAFCTPCAWQEIAIERFEECGPGWAALAMYVLAIAEHPRRLARFVLALEGCPTAGHAADRFGLIWDREDEE